MAPKFPSVTTPDGCINPRWLRALHSNRQTLDYDVEYISEVILYLQIRRRLHINNHQPTFRHIYAVREVVSRMGKVWEPDYSVEAYGDYCDVLRHNRWAQLRPAQANAVFTNNRAGRFYRPELKFWPKLPKDPT